VFWVLWLWKLVEIGIRVHTIIRERQFDRKSALGYLILFIEFVVSIFVLIIIIDPNGYDSRIKLSVANIVAWGIPLVSFLPFCLLSLFLFHAESAAYQETTWTYKFTLIFSQLLFWLTYAVTIIITSPSAYSSVCPDETSCLYIWVLNNLTSFLTLVWFAGLFCYSKWKILHQIKLGSVSSKSLDKVEQISYWLVWSAVGMVIEGLTWFFWTVHESYALNGSVPAWMDGEILKWIFPIQVFGICIEGLAQVKSMPGGRELRKRANEPSSTFGMALRNNFSRKTVQRTE